MVIDQSKQVSKVCQNLRYGLRALIFTELLRDRLNLLKARKININFSPPGKK